MSSKVLFLICVVTTFLMSCQRQACSIKFRSFARHEAPFIHILKQKENCEYLFEGYFWFHEIKVISEGDLTFDDDAIFLKIDKINSSKIKYFDFSKKIGVNYDITFDSSNSSLTNSNTFSAQVENVVPSTNGVDVFIFKINEAFILNEDGNTYIADLVFFVTRENGIIGSYISKVEEGVELVIGRRGDVLENVLDYSKKEFRNIN